jgi:lipid-A-disaccharide synthase-like uncharacterized protein
MSTKTVTLETQEPKKGFDKIKSHFTGLNNQLGWIGVCLLQGATLPSMVGRILSPESATLPPFTMVFMVWLGLGFYLARAIRQNDVVYITSNGIGMFLNSVLLAMIVFP